MTTPRAARSVAREPQALLDGAEVEPGQVESSGAEPASVATSGDEAPAVWFDPAQLVPWPANPKRYSSADIDKTVQSIKRFGFGNPVLARLANREIIAGHRRTRAALKLNLKRIPVRFLDLSEDEAHKLAVADNRHATDKKQDPDLLAKLLNEWHEEGDEFDGMGFDDTEIDKLLGETEESEVEELDVSDAQAEFFLSVSGPLTLQPEALEVLRQRLLGIEGLQVELTTTEL